jgi:CHAT domain-containing protein/tetratricopeptide (TPR) repeat protein
MFSNFRLILWLLLIPVVSAGASGNEFSSDDPAALDSLVRHDRAVCYRYLERQLEVYFNENKPELRDHLARLADIIQRHHDDSWFVRQVRLYGGWSESERAKRQALLERFSSMSPTDTSLSEISCRELATAFLQLGDSAAAVKVYYNGGLILGGQGKSAAALLLATDVLRLSRLANYLEGRALAYGSLGTLYDGLDSLEWAGVYFDSSLAIRGQMADSLGIATCLNNIGAVYQKFEHYTRARELLEEALRLRRNFADPARTVEVLLNLFEAFAEREAESTLVGWLDEARSLGAGKQSSRGQVRLWLAQSQLAQRQGKWKRARGYLDQAFALLPARGEAQLRLALLIRLASLHNTSGEYDQALTRYLEAHDLAAVAGDQLAQADILHNLGATTQRLGRHELAVGYYREAVARNRRLGRVCAVAAGLGSLIDVYLSRSELELAEKYQQQLQTTVGYCDDPQTWSRVCLTLAQLVSPAYLDTALAYYEILGDRQGLLRTLIAKAEFARKGLDFDHAAYLLDSAALVLPQVDIYENRQRYNLARGLWAYDTDRLDTAQAYLAQVIERLEATRRNLPELQLRAARQSRSRFVYETMALLWWRRASAGEQAALDSLAFYLESAKSRTLLDLLASSPSTARKQPPDSLRSQEQETLARLEFTEKRLAGVSDSLTRAAVARELDSLTHQLDRLRLRAGLKDSAARQLFEPHAISLEETRALLPDSSTLFLDYLLTPKISLLLALAKDSTWVVELPGRSHLAESLIDYLRLLRESATADLLLEPFARAGDSLTGLVFGSIAEKLPGYATLLISPDGPLSILPLGALPLAGQPLAEALEISYLPSLYLLGNEPPSSVTLDSAALLAVAVPEAEGMPSLRYSRREVQTIAEHFSTEQTEVMIGASGCKQLLQSSRARSFDFLHFATHSTINHDDPLRSRLWLSPDTADSDAYLTMAEVLELQLDAELVVLSSCESGGGRYRLGEGIEGFVRGFLHAGADRVLVSLWPVEDLGTMEFMKRFYEHLELGYSAALQQAKAEMVHSPRLRLRHPYYWSPFVLITSK